MIFGFNTDVKFNGGVYHVQSEAREADLLLQTQVFVKGQCIGKRAVSYADKLVQPDFSREQMHELLKAQHKSVLDAVREGRPEAVSLSQDVEDAGGSGLSMRWVNADTVYTDSPLLMNLQVLDAGRPADGALITCRLSMSMDAPIHAQAVTDESGSAAIEILMDDPSSHELAVLVRANHDDKSATRKFRLKIDL